MNASSILLGGVIGVGGYMLLKQNQRARTNAAVTQANAQQSASWVNSIVSGKNTPAGMINDETDPWETQQAAAWTPAAMAPIVAEYAEYTKAPTNTKVLSLVLVVGVLGTLYAINQS